MASKIKLKKPGSLQRMCNLAHVDGGSCRGRVKALLFPLHENTTNSIALCAIHMWELQRLLEQERAVVARLDDGGIPTLPNTDVIKSDDSALEEKE